MLQLDNKPCSSYTECLDRFNWLVGLPISQVNHNGQGVGSSAAGESMQVHVYKHVFN